MQTYMPNQAADREGMGLKRIVRGWVLMEVGPGGVTLEGITEVDLAGCGSSGGKS